MRFVDGSIVLSPTDLSGFLTCRHRTGLDLAVVHGALNRPMMSDPFAALLQRLGEEHERRHVEALRGRGLRVVDLGRSKDRPLRTEETGPRGDAARQTLDAMRDGVDVIVQARLDSADLAGYADVLIRVDAPSDLGAWSYEVQDTKLARETKGGTILQLSAYSALVGEVQGRLPERFHVITPDPARPTQSYRVEDYAAYYRMVLASLREAVQLGHEALAGVHYPEPVDACSVCQWDARCIARRRADDHLSFIANAGRVHRVELATQGVATLAEVAAMPVPVMFKPSRGARETYDRIGHQARVQHQQREEGHPVYETFPIVAGEGLCRLPEPSPGDLFLDLEGARFAREGGREYLFGVWEMAPTGRAARYRAFWATRDSEEKAAFEQMMDLIMDAWARDPGMHVYHFNHYEPTAFKKLMGRHATRAEPVDQLLRAERFVDLYPITRQALRAGVESYSIKKLEPMTGYWRALPLGDITQALMAAELALESGAVDAIGNDIRRVILGYNQDDCRSTEALRNWLERLRGEWIAKGIDVPRPEAKSGDPSPEVSELQKQAAALRARLLDGLADEARDPAHPNHPRWLLAYLVDFHKREENAEWWEYYRLKGLPSQDLVDERNAIVGLTFVSRLGPVIGKTGKPTKSVVDRYSYPAQEVEIGGKGTLHMRDGRAFGHVVAHNRIARLIDVEKGPSRADLHPTEVFSAEVISTRGPQKAVMRVAEQYLDSSRCERTASNDECPPSEGCGIELLHRRAPRLRSEPLTARPAESAQQLAVRIVPDLDATTLPIQGPPGAGKTHVGAEMIRELLRRGKRVGVTATSHKVIRNLLLEVLNQARTKSEAIIAAARVKDLDEDEGGIREFTNDDEALAMQRSGEVHVLGGTPWFWSCEAAARHVDVLFVDEAGQMSLGNVLAVSHAADSIVLLGDPQQLDQPQKAAHPDGVGVSALQHVLGEHETMPDDRGIFLPTTWRMSPTLCAFTSEQFYERKLEARPNLCTQVLCGTGAVDGSHLWLLPVKHDGNQNASDEEVDLVARLVEQLLQPGAGWVDACGVSHTMTAQDLRVVAPFNAQVNRLVERLGPRGVPVGTVDKFQGQTAVVVIYSMTTSRPEDAPRGMEFLYSLNRLNVATSRARCAVFLVASPRLFEPECRTPRQMQLANALCRYREMARVIVPLAPKGNV